MTTHEEVLGFISRFTAKGRFDQVITAFSCGCCYWFAKILLQRFTSKPGTLMYDQTINHFGTKIAGRVYDITGDVTDRYNWMPWDDLRDTALKQRIVRDCINFTE